MFPHPSSGPAAPVRLQLIGDFQVFAGPEPVRIRRCGQKLLAMLALSPTALGRPTLAGRLWPDSPGSRAAANLRAAISRLPRPLNHPLVKSVGDRLLLTDDVLVDLHDAHDLIGNHDAVKDPAPTSWCADLLPTWDEDWVLLERERYRQARLHALEGLSQQLREQRRYGEAMASALAALSGEPLRESAHRLVIEVHLAEGNAAEALQQYHLYRELLRSELGIAPSAGMRHLVRPLLERPED